MKHRAFDAYPEKQIQEASPDKIASSRTMLSEVNDLALMGMAGTMASRRQSSLLGSELTQLEREIANSRKSMNSRDGIALCSIAFCSPLMLFGVGATLAIADELRMVKESGLRNKINTTRLYPLQKSLFASENEGNANKSAETFKIAGETNILEAGRSKKISEKKTSKCKSDKFFLSVEHHNTRVQKPGRNWLKANKILKEKQTLIDWLEKNQGKLDLNAVSEAMAKIELLDKELKRLGC